MESSNLESLRAVKADYDKLRSWSLERAHQRGAERREMSERHAREIQEERDKLAPLEAALAEERSTWSGYIAQRERDKLQFRALTGEEQLRAWLSAIDGRTRRKFAGPLNNPVEVWIRRVFYVSRNACPSGQPFKVTITSLNSAFAVDENGNGHPPAAFAPKETSLPTV